MSKTKQLQQQFEELPMPVKIGIGFVAAFGVYKLYQAIAGDDNKAGGQSEDNMIVDVSNLTYDRAQYQVFADGIEAAVFGTYGIVTPWEDDETVAAILQRMYTLDDVKQLIKVYGSRYTNVLGNEGGNLVFTVTSYLDDDLIEETNQVYEDRGINFFW